MTLQDFIGNYQHITYLGIFAFLGFIDFLILVPEEVILLSVGYVVSAANLNIFLGLLITVVGVLVGDNILFWLSRHSRRFTNKLMRKIKPETLEKFEKKIDKDVVKAVTMLRLLPGLRALSAVLPGMMGVKWGKYQLADILVVSIYGSAMYLLGYFFYGQLSALIGNVEKIRHLIFVIFEIALTAGILFYSYRRFFRDREK